MVAALRCLALGATCLLLSAPALADAAASAEAKRLYAAGKAEYAQGRYQQAAELFAQSYALSESPALLFNMAQAHRLVGVEGCPDAVTLYKSYLAALPDAENRREVEERLAELGDCRATTAVTDSRASVDSAPDQTVAPPAAASPAKSGLPTGPVLTAGAGAALLVAGGVLYARAWDKHREAEQLCPCYPGTYSDWEVLTNVSYALLAVGGATLVGGVSWWVVGQPSQAGQPSRAMLGVTGAF